MFATKYTATLGVDFFFKRIQLGDQPIQFNLYDIGGTQLDNPVLPMYLKGTNCIMFVYDMKNNKSLENINLWQQKLTQNGISTQNSVLIGNKLDLCNWSQHQQQCNQQQQRDLTASLTSVNSINGSVVKQSVCSSQQQPEKQKELLQSTSNTKNAQQQSNTQQTQQQYQETLQQVQQTLKPLQCFTLSALTGENVQKTFISIAGLLLNEDFSDITEQPIQSHLDNVDLNELQKIQRQGFVVDQNTTSQNQSDSQHQKNNKQQKSVIYSVIGSVIGSVSNYNDNYDYQGIEAPKTPRKAVKSTKIGDQDIQQADVVNCRIKDVTNTYSGDTSTNNTTKKRRCFAM